MAYKKPEPKPDPKPDPKPAHTPAPEPVKARHTRPTVLVHAGHEADGSIRTSRVEVDTNEHHPRERVAHVGGVPLEHVADAADGEFIYSAGRAQER
jgi:hypothetical protein